VGVLTVTSEQALETVLRELWGVKGDGRASCYVT
jgi:hypothetical protein